MHKKYDAVIVGARVAGASTALLLARAGAHVALLDRTAHGTDTPSTHALMRGGVIQLSRWKLLQDVVDAGTPAVRRTLFHYAGDESVQVSIRPSPGVDALYAPRRHVLDRILVDAAAEAGADVMHRVHATRLLDAPQGVGGVQAVTAGGKSLLLKARIVVGADGIRSLVANRVNAPVLRQGTSASAVLYRYYAELPVAGYEWAYGDGAAAGMIPTNDGLTCVFVATTPSRMRHLRASGPQQAFDALLSQVAPDLGSRVRCATGVGRWHGWKGIPGFLRRSWGPGWALVGDAGYFKDPITTHGMTDAMRDAELLAEAIVEYLSRNVADPMPLRAYQHQRDVLSSRLFETTEKVAGYDWDMPQVKQLLREVSSAMTDEVELLQERETWEPRAIRAATADHLVDAV